MLACSPARNALASASVRPTSASVPATAGRLIVTNSVASTSPRSVLASNRTVHRIAPAIVVRRVTQPDQPGTGKQPAPGFCHSRRHAPDFDLSHVGHRVSGPVPVLEHEPGLAILDQQALHAALAIHEHHDDI